MKLLLIEPSFPRPGKSKNHNGFYPAGLLKLAGYYRKRGHTVLLAKEGRHKSGYRPDKVLITSLFTYWADYVRRAVVYYRDLYPSARIIVGGIYASLMPDHCKSHTGCDEVFVGVSVYVCV